MTLMEIDMASVGFQFLVDNERAVRQLCRRYGLEHEEDLWDVAVDRVRWITELFDDSSGVSRKAYVLGSLRRYMLKWIVSVVRRRSKLEGLYEQEHTYRAGEDFISECDDRDAVYNVLENVSSYDRKLLVLHVVVGMSFAEIGELLGFSTGTAHTHYSLALRRAKSRA